MTGLEVDDPQSKFDATGLCFWDGCNTPTVHVVATIGGTRFACPEHSQYEYTRMHR